MTSGNKRMNLLKSMTRQAKRELGHDAILLFSTCVPLFPFCMLLVFCLNFLYLWFPCSYVPLACFLPCSSVIVLVITNQDSTSSRLLPGSSYSCCIRNLHALVHKQCHPVHITTAHEILQRQKWQLCKLTLPPNHSGSWARKEKLGFVIHSRIVHSQSCTSLAATRRPIQSLMPAKFHPQVVATEADRAMLSTNDCGMRSPACKYGCGRDSSPSGAVRKHCT
jgi:hypothetical protein